jgi:hypothetical protein
MLAPTCSTTHPFVFPSQPTFRSFGSRPTGHVIALVALALEPQAKMAWPADFPRACHGEQLYLCQCQPTTTLSS